MSKDTIRIAENPGEEAQAGAADAVAACGPADVSVGGTGDPSVPDLVAPVAESAAAPAAGASLSSAEIQALQDRAAKAEEHRDRFLRTAADFENFKKRAARERQEAVRYANEALLGKLVSVLDNFEMALTSEPSQAGAASTSGDPFRAGVAMIQGQLRSVLVEAGLEEVNAAGQPFNPNLHEGVAHQESTEVPEGHVMQQLRKGYKYRDRLLRPASVVVARAPVAPVVSDGSAPVVGH